VSGGTTDAPERNGDTDSPRSGGDTDRRARGGVSIVVPVHGRAALTRRCLDTLLATLLAKPPCAFEVIVVDDASTDGTPALLRSYGEAIRRVSLTCNRGYAGACNEGAAIARHDTLVFLNNDTEPRQGWLQELLAYADAHPAAAIVGAKLLYPGGDVQHAGVAIGQDRYPHNLYAGLPADHPAVNRSRRLQAVTGACMLVRRAAFEEAGGFDTAYSNSLEDVDLCLRLGETGAEVHYCHRAVLTHLESASRGRTQRFEASVARYRRRWRDRVLPDDLAIYAQDGLLQLEYRDAYPLRLSISPLLASLGGERQPQIETLLETYAAQVAELMAEVVRLSTLAGVRPQRRRATDAAPLPRMGGLDHRAFLAHANRLEEQVRELQQRLEDADVDGGETGAQGEVVPAFTASRSLGYRRLVERVRAAVAEIVPEDASLLVVSRGDNELLRLGASRAAHFPQAASGGYLGHHPRDSEEAIAGLEALRERGADYLVLPSTSCWWLEHYADFAAHLHARYPVQEADACTIFALRGGRVASAGQALGAKAGRRRGAGVETIRR
jgi:GT2 family glycosyltransferase